MKYNPDIHHRRSIRLKGYDYSAGGVYFVTICVQERLCLFGDIENGEMRPNDAGRMVVDWWLKLPEKFPHVALDEYVIMPNHFHGIIVLNDFDRRGATLCSPACDVGATLCSPAFDCFPTVDEIQNLGEHKVSPVQNQKRYEKQNHSPGDHENRHHGTIENSLGRVIQAFKSMTSVEYVHGVKVLNWPSFPGRLWQRNYYERVIRDYSELSAIREYIHFNPAKWFDDEENLVDSRSAGRY